MAHWTEIRFFTDLEAFQEEFRTMAPEQKQIIIDEMNAYIDDYKKRIKIIEASTSREEPPLLRKRRGRARAPKRTP